MLIFTDADSRGVDHVETRLLCGMTEIIKMKDLNKIVTDKGLGGLNFFFQKSQNLLTSGNSCNVFNKSGVDF